MTALAPALQAYFTDRLIGQRSASPNTIAAYRHTFRLLLAFATERTGKPPSQLDIAQLDAPLIAAFLQHLEHERGNSAATRNNRLAAIHSLFAYLALHHPEHAASIQRVLAIPPKRTERNLLTYLTEPEVDALLAACDQATWTGRRDHAMFALTIQTGLRISELISSPARTSRSPPAPTCTPSARDARSGARRWCRPPGSCSRPGWPNAPAPPTTRCSRRPPANASAATRSNAASPATSQPLARPAPRSPPSTSRCTRSGTPPRCDCCSPATTSP